MKLNLNTILIALGGLGVFVPGIDWVSAQLVALHIVWLGTVIRALGLLAAFCSAAPLAVPVMRGFLASLGLATPPGAQAPWDPKRDNVAPMIRVAREPDPGSVTVPVSRMDAETPVLPRKPK